ncbi:MAG: hypothetical protein SVX43_15845 [Cyanobacteriota bacterium]|nr:hypothetical protein [Cyanobacteriota bacterium]
MRTLMKIFGVIMVLSLWLSTNAAPALAAETELTLEKGSQLEVPVESSRPTDRVLIVCGKTDPDAQQCYFRDNKFCNANLCKPGSTPDNQIPANAVVWKYKVDNLSKETIFLKQSQNDSCALQEPRGGRIQAEEKDVSVRYICQPPIQYLSNYITLEKNGKDQEIPALAKVIFKDLDCEDSGM